MQSFWSLLRHRQLLLTLNIDTDTNDFYFFDSAITGPGYLIDTPGIDESNRTRTDTEIMMTIENSLKEVQFRDKLLMGLIFLYDIHQPRAYGSILNVCPQPHRDLRFLTDSI